MNSTMIKTSDMRINNILSIVRFVRKQPLSTKPQIGKALNLSRPTVNNLVDNLINNNILRNKGFGLSGPLGGKPPILVSFNERSALVVGIALGRKTTSVTLTDLAARSLDRIDFPTNYSGGPDDWFARVKEAYNKITKDISKSTSIVGLGIAVRGAVESETGALKYAAHLPEWKNIPFVTVLSDLLNIPVFIESEAYAYAVAEKLFGAATDIDNFVTIFCGEAVGAGILIDGKLYHGANGMAGEIGHTVVDQQGELCYCGNYGCLETIVSSTALLKFIQNNVKETESILSKIMNEDKSFLQMHHVNKAIQLRDPLAIKSIKRISNYLGDLLTFIVNMTNPTKIIICGEIAELGKPLLDELYDKIRSNSLRIAADQTELILSEFGEKKSPIAGASLAINQLFLGGIDHFLNSNL